MQCFISIPEDDESKYRIGFLSTSFVVCLLVISGFLFRKCCRCVQIKGKITQVTIKDGQQLTVHVQNEVYIEDQPYSFNYNIAKKTIEADDCDHAELYRNDIERIIKLPQKISTIEEVGVDNINNRITVRHHIQEQHYQEVFTINNGRMEIVESEEDVAEGGEGEEEEEEEEEEDVAAQENAGGDHENMIQDEEDLQERQIPLHSLVSDIKNDQGDDSEETSLLPEDSTEL